MGNTGLAVFYFFFVKRSNPNVMNQKLDLKKKCKRLLPRKIFLE